MRSIEKEAVAEAEGLKSGIENTVSDFAKRWGIEDVGQIASAVGLSSLMAFAKRIDWQPIRRRVMAKPLQTVALVAVGVGAVILVRRMMDSSSPEAKMSGEKLHH